MRNYNPNSVQYFKNLQGRGYKRWQLQGALNKKPRFLPEFLWVRFLRYLFNFS